MKPFQASNDNNCYEKAGKSSTVDYRAMFVIQVCRPINLITNTTLLPV